jgi:protein ImuB
VPFACLFVPDFPVQAVVRLETELRGKPVAILDGAAPLTKVFAANAAAKTLGVEIGMTKVQAEACSGIAWRWRSHPQEATAHAALLDCAWTISPRVEENAKGSEEELPDTVVLDIAGCEKLFGSPEKIAGDLKRVAAKVGFDANVAVAGNPEAAICAARGFPGITVIPAGSEGDRLGTLPLSSLKIPPELLDTLTRWGIHTCAEFAALPEVAIVERLGQEGRRLQLLARGCDPRPLIPKEPPTQFDECMDLEFPVELLEPLMFVLNRLLDQLCMRLRMHVLATSEIKVTLTLQINGGLQVQPAPVTGGLQAQPAPEADSRAKETPLHVRTLKLPVPAKESKFLLKLLQLDLQAHPPSAPVVAVRISAVPTRSRTRQQGLFLPLSPEPERLEVTLARIQSTVGEGRVGAPVLLDTHRPNAFQQTHFVLPESSTKTAASRRQATAALRIYRPPLPAFVEQRDAKPAGIVCDGARREILALAGPWRTKGDWWSETAWARDEWDVLIQTFWPKFQADQSDFPEEKIKHNPDGLKSKIPTLSGPILLETAVYRIYRDIRLRRWFVEGIYD